MAFLFRDAAGVPRATASTEDSVLIIIDAQNEYADGMLKVSDVAASRAVIASLLERYRSAGQGKKNVVHVVHRVPAGTPVFTPGTPLEEEFEELRPREGEKVSFLSFFFFFSFISILIKEFQRSMCETECC